MKGDAAERYYSKRVRTLSERQARRQEWDFLASRLEQAEIVDRVGPGWHELVLTLHADLLALDSNYRLYAVEEELGGLVFTARVARRAQIAAARRIQATRAEALATCEVCGATGKLRAERSTMKTLCDACWHSDRAAAARGGERYADAVLATFLSGDEDHPSPEETLAWLDELDAS
jgi:hypothetical protein